MQLHDRALAKHTQALDSAAGTAKENPSLLRDKISCRFMWLRFCDWPGVVVHASNPRIGDSEAEGYQEFEASRN